MGIKVNYPKRDPFRNIKYKFYELLRFIFEYPQHNNITKETYNLYRSEVLYNFRPFNQSEFEDDMINNPKYKRIINKFFPELIHTFDFINDIRVNLWLPNDIHYNYCLQLHDKKDKMGLVSTFSLNPRCH